MGMMQWFRKSFIPSEPRRGYTSTVSPPGWLQLYKDGGAASYGEVFKASPSLQAVVGLIAMNAAQLPISCRELPGRGRLGPKDPLVRLLNAPNPQTSGLSFRQQLYTDLLVFANFYAVMVDGDDLPSEFAGPGTPAAGALVRVPPDRVAIIDRDDTETWGYEVSFSGGTRRYDPDEILHVHGPNPGDSRYGVSRLEGLRTLLAEERLMVEWRARYWQSGARPPGILEKPVDSPDWGDPEWERFTESWSKHWVTGATPVVEDGLRFHELKSSARDSQYVESLNAVVQIVGRAFGVPAGLLGPGAARSQHRRSLMQDSVLPVVSLVDAELTRQVVHRVKGDSGSNVVVQTDSSEFLAGDFETLVETLAEAVRSGLLSPNEGREILGRGRVTNGDSVYVTPNIVQLGIQEDAGE